MKRMKLLQLVSALVLIFGIGSGVHAADRVALYQGSLELLPAGVDSDGSHLYGLRFSLGKKWYTYWTNPAGSGVPPIFDHGASENVAGVEYLWPVPEYYSTPYATSIVYHEQLLLPIRVMPVDQALPVALSLNATFGVCSDVCIPEQATLKAASDQQTFQPLLRRELAAVIAEVPARHSDTLAVTSVVASKQDGSPVLRVRTVDRSGTEQLTLFADAGAALPLGRAKIVSRRGDDVEFVVFAGAEGQTGTPVKLLLVNAAEALEMTLEISQ